SIIIGNGINYAIVLMSRYEEERAASADPSEALLRAIGGTGRGPPGASIAAPAAPPAPMGTRLRRLLHLGGVGAVGARACWAATFTVLPALLALLDRRRGTNGVHAPRAPLNLGPLATLLRKQSMVLTAVFGVLSVASVYGLTHFLKDPFEYDFRK